MKTQELGRRLYQGVLDHVFPPQCAACRVMGTWLCEACAALLERLEKPYCSRCAQPLAAGLAAEGPVGGEREQLCGRCGVEPLALSVISAAYLMRGPAREMVHRLKYDGWRALAPVLAEALARELARSALKLDVIVPVPLHRSRERERGYNQAELLATEVGRLTGIRVERRSLARWRATASLVRANDAEERRAVVTGAFRWMGAPLAGNRTLLVDDVCTTGSTLDACARVVLSAGAADVAGLVVAREP